MQIVEAIIHKIEKDKETSGPASITITPRSAKLTLNDYAKKLGEDILTLYTRLNPSYGVLGQDPNLHHFSSHLADYATEQTETFIEFSQKILGVIANAMSQQRFTTTSYPLLIRYTNQGRDWVLIAILKLKENISIDEDTLDLDAALVFAVQDLREAARIDVRKWQGNEQPYLSFIKRGSGSDTESSRYFRTALSCIEYTDSKHHTDAAINALNSYCKEKKWKPDLVMAAHQRFYQYCDEKKRLQEPVNLTALSTIIDDQSPHSFIAFIHDNSLEVNNNFEPHKSSYTKLRRIKSQFGSITLGFDVDDIATAKIVLSKNKKSIIISEPPQQLIESINSARGELDAD